MSRNGWGAVSYGEDKAKWGRHHCQVRDVTIDVEFRAMVFSPKNQHEFPVLQ
jgi:hypothetical protein